MNIRATIATSSAIVILGISALLALGSSLNESAIFDETAHIGAGYSYLTQKDMRLNPEHPPLIKDIAAVPLLFLDLSFPTNTEAWQNQVNGQWDQGGQFLFEFENNPDLILFWARLPIIIIAFLTGLLLFFWVRSLYGNRVAVLATFFFAFSPTIIAHSRYVTTDIAATLGFLIGVATFVRFLARPTLKRTVIAGVAFGIAQSLKFSLVLLVPIDALLAIIWFFVREKEFDARPVRDFFSLAVKTAAVFAIGVVVVWGTYVWHIWNYPQERQLSDAQTLIGNYRSKPLVALDLWLINHEFTRPLGQYLYGVMLVSQRTAGGNSAYFLGQVSSEGWVHYFPTIYLTKETLGFHILSVFALLLALMRVWRAPRKTFDQVREWTRDNFPLFASIFFIIVYWGSSVANPLNIGVRHVLPAFPFACLLVARELVIWTSGPHLPPGGGLWYLLHNIYQKIIAPFPRYIFLGLVFAWMVLSVFAGFPYYLSYYNEIGGSTKNGYRIATDSNYDWGQDLKRLRDFARANPQEKIYLHYFGGSTNDSGAQRYWLGDQFIPWYSSFGPPPSGSLFAVSVNELMGKWARPTKGFPASDPNDTYEWLKDKKPTARAGTSIFIYRIP